jgi:hypothetical protein
MLTRFGRLHQVVATVNKNVNGIMAIAVIPTYEMTIIYVRKVGSSMLILRFRALSEQLKRLQSIRFIS